MRQIYRDGPFMKGISCNSNLLSDLPVEQAMDVLGEHGYAAIDICLEIAPPLRSDTCPAPQPPRRVRQARAGAKAGRKTPASPSLPSMPTPTSAPEIRRSGPPMPGFWKVPSEWRPTWGAPIVVTAGGGKNAYGYEQWFFDWAVEVLRQVLPTAQRLGIALAIEAGSPAGSLIYNLETMRKLLDTSGLEGLQALFDCAHYHIRRDSPVEVFNTLKDRVVHMHAKDAAGDPENIVFPPAGSGGGGLRRLAGRHGPGRLRRLHRHGVRGLCLGVFQGLPQGSYREQGLPRSPDRQALGLTA